MAFKFVVTIEPENDTNCGNCPFATNEDDGGSSCVVFGQELKHYGGWELMHSPRRLEECKQAEKEGHGA